MIIKRAALSRRTLLRGAGAAVMLPFLDAMVPAFATKAQTKSVKRFGVVYLPNGMVLRNFVPPSAGPDFEITRLLQPLEKHRDQLTIVSGLSNARGRCARSWRQRTAFARERRVAERDTPEPHRGRRPGLWPDR